MGRSKVSRRAFLGGMGLGIALPALSLIAEGCAPAAPLPSTAGEQRGGAAWEQEWAQLVEAAKREGSVTLFTTTAYGSRKWMDAFEAAFPGISMEPVTLSSSDLLPPKIFKEREAGIFTFDVIIASAVIATPRLVPFGALDPLRPLLFRPDVLDDTAWRDGFESGWVDNDRRWGYAMDERLGVWGIDTDQVREGEITQVTDLLNPKWKGRIIMQDPRAGANYAQMAAVHLSAGEDVLRRLLVDQEPVFSRDTRQVVEGLVRGKFAIANNVTKSILQEFLDAGLAKNVRLIPVRNAMHVANAGAVWAANRAPHPNAAKLVVNWLLTKEGATVFCQASVNNSLRKDVAPIDLVSAPETGAPYFRSSLESSQPELDKVQALINGWLNIKN